MKIDSLVFTKGALKVTLFRTANRIAVCLSLWWELISVHYFAPPEEKLNRPQSNFQTENSCFTQKELDPLRNPSNFIEGLILRLHASRNNWVRFFQIPWSVFTFNRFLSLVQPDWWIIGDEWCYLPLLNCCLMVIQFALYSLLIMVQHLLFLESFRDVNIHAVTVNLWSTVE